MKFEAVATVDAKGRVTVALPFDPDEVWGKKDRHHIRGKVGGHGVRGSLRRTGDAWALVLGPAWARDCRVEGTVEVLLEPEGPQRDGLDPDIAVALDASPEAGAFFDSLATFYRKGYLRWIASTKRRPDVRAARIAEMVELLKAGKKERPG